MGSKIHANQLKKNKTQVRGMLCFEMIGFFSTDSQIQKLPSSLLSLFFPSHGDWIALIGRLDQIGFIYSIKKAMQNVTDLQLYSLGVPSIFPLTNFSDHRNYWVYDIPAVMITNTAFMRNRRYHPHEDTFDTLNYQRTCDVILMTYQALIKLLQQ